MYDDSYQTWNGYGRNKSNRYSCSLLEKEVLVFSVIEEKKMDLFVSKKNGFDTVKITKNCAMRNPKWQQILMETRRKKFC